MFLPHSQKQGKSLCQVKSLIETENNKTIDNTAIGITTKFEP